MFGDFIKGARFFLAGFGLMLKPGVRLFVIVPVIINTLVFIALFMAARHYLTEFNAWFAHFLPAWLQWISSLLWLLFFISFFLILVYTFTLVANAIAAPFNGFLSEKVEIELTGRMPESRTLWQNVKDIPRILGRQFGVLLYYLPRALLLFALFFIPVVQVIAAPLWLLFHAWFMTLIYIDYPTDNHRVSLRDTRAVLGRRRAVALGFGVSVLVATMVPVLNFFTIPAAVAGATALWLDSRDLA